MLWSNLSFAELSATADRRTIAIGETLRLTLLGDAGEQPAEIDLTPLNRDWEILSRSSATNARFINGQNQVTRTLEMELAPLREGTLTIPSLTAGGRSTTPLAIRVNPEPVVAPGDELVLFDASVGESSVFVQSEVILTVTLQQAIALDGLEISNFDIPDAVVENLERRSFQRRVGNRTWLVTELRYAVYPQKSGALRIPAIGFTAREVQPGRSLLGARLGRRLRMASEPLEIKVKSVPTSFPGEVWLPARALTLEENWSIDPASLTVGDSTTRPLTLTARGLQGSQLPPLSSVQGAINIPELRFYPDQESIDQIELAEGLQGRRVQSEALVARSGGTWTLPEIRVPWWNIETNRLEFATLPARTVVVTAIQTADQTNDPTIAPSASPAGTTLPLWLWAVSAAGWLVSLALGILLWLSRRHTAGHSPAPGGATAKSGSVRQALVEIRKAAAQEDAALLRKAILQWADLHHERGFSSLEALARVSTESLATRLRAVDRSLYGDGELVSALEGLIDMLREEPAPESRGMGANTLSLYPL
ncbi:MAG: forkhead-associated protein [Alteromonadaceae bacterium]|nr:forkhead-associated protein [Alteromonadaceae bacterium]